MENSSMIPEKKNTIMLHNNIEKDFSTSTVLPILVVSLNIHDPSHRAIISYQPSSKDFSNLPNVYYVHLKGVKNIVWAG